ncbi:MAG: ribose-5-phosphate isomerase A, partial [Armatimonadota bacterium]|nr:ribose-5-phosphate isomerase A [Armatimonadota bacterium]
PIAARLAKSRIEELGGSPQIRQAKMKDGPVITDNGNFVIDGLLFPNRKPSPGLIEYKKVLEPVRVEAADLERGAVRVTNLYQFVGLRHLHLCWSVVADGRVLQCGSLPAPDAGPGESVLLEIPLRRPARLAPGTDYWLNLSFVLAEEQAWASAGHEVAWQQFRLPWEAPAVPRVVPASMPRLYAEEVGNDLVVHGADFGVVMDRVRGVFTCWLYQGQTLLHWGPRLDFWRAPTDNDRNWVAEWRRHGLHALQHRVERVEHEVVDERVVRIRVASRIAPPVWNKAYRCEVVYTLYGSGDMVVEAHGVPEGEWPNMIPRVALRLALPGSLERVTWYGRGPGESYVDSKQANRFGVWRASVDELYTPYVTPQECGNHTDTRWVALTDWRGMGLLAVGQPEMDFSALRYTPEELDEAKHTCELVPGEEITLHLGWKHNGLGSASCGPGPLPQYQLHAEEFRFAVRLRPFSVDGASPVWLAKQGVG